MPPLRRRGRAPRSAAAPYRKKPAVASLRREDRGRADDQGDDHHPINGTCLQDDALAVIFSRFRDTADVIRCAATCRRWGHVVATRAAFLSRAPLPPLGRFLPRCALGVFHQENDAPTARIRSKASVKPRFVPAASAARLPALRRDPLMGSRNFDNSRPVASRNGRLVLELQPESHADGLKLCVCNPVTGDVAMLPPLSGSEKPRDYGCAVLTGDDHDPPRSLASFRVLLVYNRRGFTALRCYSSDAGQWGPEAMSNVKISSWELRCIGQAVVRRGVAFWPMDHGALGVRLGATDSATMDAHLLPYEGPHYWPHRRLLGVSPDNRLFFVYFSIRAGVNILIASLSYFAIDGDDIGAGRQECWRLEEAVPMHQMKLACPQEADTLKLRWFCEKSGLVLFTLGEGSGHNGTFALNLQEKVVEKVADGEGDSWRNFVGYEMDRASYFASITP